MGAEAEGMSSTLVLCCEVSEEGLGIIELSFLDTLGSTRYLNSVSGMHESDLGLFCAVLESPSAPEFSN